MESKILEENEYLLLVLKECLSNEMMYCPLNLR
jgi:hypothetical protein